MSDKKPTMPMVISFLGGIVWLIFVLLHSLFWSKDFTLFQNGIIGLVSFLVVGSLIALLWVIWGIR